MRLIRKLSVLIPVVVLGFIYLNIYSERFSHTSGKRILFFGISFLLLFAVFLTDALKREESSLWRRACQSSFYVYLFMVLILTGYFILFREVSVHNWWHNMMVRIDSGDRVNLKLFKIFSIYRFSDKQILGNLVLLFPLGIYLPLLFSSMNSLFKVVFVSLLFSLVIECIQLITRYRSADIDDVLLNTSGAFLGYIFYQLILLFSSSTPSKKTSALA